MADNGGRLGRRLGRILVLLPYAIRHPGVSVAELATKFGVSKKDLLDDLNLVFLCGLPGYGPGDLIDVELQEEHVYVRMADYFSAPLRLTPTEALALYAGAAAIAPDDPDAALSRGLRKLGRALGVERTEGTPGVAVSLERGSETHLETVRAALDEREQLQLEYFTPSRSEVTERTVDPWGLVAARGHWYLVAGDHSSGEERMFRLDRIKSVERTGDAADVPDEFDPSAYKGAFRPDPQDVRVSFEISPEVARWFEEYYPIVSAEDAGDGWRRIELATGNTRWAAILLLQLGGDVRSISPAKLVTEAKELAASLAAQHS